jgi:hypothetical protein
VLRQLPLGVALSDPHCLSEADDGEAGGEEQDEPDDVARMMDGHTAAGLLLASEV